MRLNVFRQFLLEGNIQNSPENVVQSTADLSTSECNENKSEQKQKTDTKITKEKNTSGINVDPKKRTKSSQREVSIYRSKTGSVYATKAPRLPSSNKENENNIKLEKEKSPQAEQRNIRKRKYIGVVSKTKDASIEDKNEKTEKVHSDQLGWCQLVYSILTLQFLRDLIVLSFNICKQRLTVFTEHYIFCPFRRTRDQILLIIDSIKTWCFQQLDIYLFQPIDYIRNSYLEPFYRHSCNFIQSIQWCITNSKKYCAILFDVLCLRLAKLAENFRHYFAVLFLTNVVPENYSMAYHLFALFRLVLGTLYPAYASYKAVRTKNVREYVSN
jgi:hypothetical protein